MPRVLGHQVVGRVVSPSSKFEKGDLVGVAWIYSACGKCRLCSKGHENVCDEYKATGCHSDGGYAEYMTVKEDFAYAIPKLFTSSEAAPLLCAGAIGYRSLRLTRMKDGDLLGLTGFGASGHLCLKLVKAMYPKSKVYVFARSPKEREFALELGAVWSGKTEDEIFCSSSGKRILLDAIIDTTPAWKPVVEALNNLAPCGRLVINAIRKERGDQDYLQKLDYPRHLWKEKEIKSVANVERRDVVEFLQWAEKIPIRPHVKEYELEKANVALLEVKNRKIKGAKVLRISPD